MVQPCPATALGACGQRRPRPLVPGPTTPTLSRAPTTPTLSRAIKGPLKEASFKHLQKTQELSSGSAITR